ncbi:YhgE/Pip domain-containing protein [Varibaculum cambriense]|uniref:YhgE/Pip domain-containing protein n=1 Tax=Varibaculum cambriense TaxID=184870 RepID=UPI002914E5C5|nr:YhgE/Pip domain-containing protein [Varibaculum cambriense]MDU5541969.1 YhgE/Pip domain-containing protein [Varibaculum cambriense]
MNEIFFIIRDDFRQIRSSIMVRISIVLLIAVPLFFTWFNVLATWSPFSNSGRLQIAVASTDEGYTSKILNVKVNVGDTVLKELAVNDQFDWVLTSEDKALEGARSGEYYAAIVLPKDFSHSMFTFYAGGAAPANITLYTNEKKNPLSSNLTNQGAQGVTAKINTVFSQTLAEVTVGIAEDVSAYLDTADTQAALDRLSNRLETLSAQLNSGANTFSSLSILIGSAVPLATGAKHLAAGVQDSFEGAIGSTLDSRGKNAAGSANPFAVISSELDDAVNLAGSNLANLQKQLDKLLDSANSTTQSSAATIEELQTLLDKQIAGFQRTRDALEQALGPGGADWQGNKPAVDRLLADMDAAIARQQVLSEQLGAMADDLRRGGTRDLELRQAAKRSIAEAKQAIGTAQSNYEKNLQPKIKSLRENLESAGTNVEVFRSHLKAVQADLSESAGGMIETMRRSQKTLDNTAKKMRDGASRLNQAHEQITSAQAKGGLDKVAATLGADPEGFARLISSPVAVQRNSVFPVATFGVGMTPLFTVIALWVGALLAGVFLRTDVSANVGKRYLDTIAARKPADTSDEVDTDEGESSRSEEANPKPEEPGPTSDEKSALRKPLFSGAQEYLGRYFMFWMIGMAQSTLLMLGLIVFVEIEPAHPFLLILAGWVISTVFTNIVYTLVVALANAGKALAVLLLVLQISAAGGAYPLELLPQWFQNISPLLPATYAINLMRSAIAGIYAGDFAYNLLIILVFLIPNLVLGVVSRHTIAGRIHDTAQKIEKTKVM